MISANYRWYQLFSSNKVRNSLLYIILKSWKKYKISVRAANFKRSYKRRSILTLRNFKNQPTRLTKTILKQPQSLWTTSRKSLTKKIAKTMVFRSKCKKLKKILYKIAINKRLWWQWSIRWLRKLLFSNVKLVKLKSQDS